MFLYVKGILLFRIFQNIKTFLTLLQDWCHRHWSEWIMSEMEQTFLDSSGGGGRSSSSSIKRTVTYKASDLSLSGKGSDITMQHISEAKGYLNEFEQMYRKHRGEIDALKRDHASEVRQCMSFNLSIKVTKKFVQMSTIKFPSLTFYSPKHRMQCQIEVTLLRS